MLVSLPSCKCLVIDALNAMAFYHARMPTYVYAVVNPDGTLSDHFECVQKMSEDALVQHPEYESSSCETTIKLWDTSAINESKKLQIHQGHAH